MKKLRLYVSLSVFLSTYNSYSNELRPQTTKRDNYPTLRKSKREKEKSQMLLALHFMDQFKNENERKQIEGRGCLGTEHDEVALVIPFLQKMAEFNDRFNMILEFLDNEIPYYHDQILPKAIQSEELHFVDQIHSIIRLMKSLRSDILSELEQSFSTEEWSFLSNPAQVLSDLKDNGNYTDILERLSSGVSKIWSIMNSFSSRFTDLAMMHKKIRTQLQGYELGNELSGRVNDSLEDMIQMMGLSRGNKKRSTIPFDILLLKVITNNKEIAEKIDKEKKKIEESLRQTRNDSLAHIYLVILRQISNSSEIDQPSLLEQIVSQSERSLQELDEKLDRIDQYEFKLKELQKRRSDILQRRRSGSRQQLNNDLRESVADLKRHLQGVYAL